MITVWFLVIVFFLFGCSSMPLNPSPVAASPPTRQEAPIEPPKAETKQNAANARPNKANIESAIHAADELRELLDRRRYILDAGSDEDKVH